jgi:hypothetical protein
MEQLIGDYVDQAGGQDLPERIATKVHWLVFEATHAQRLLSGAPPAAARGDGPHVSSGLRRSIWSTFRSDLVVAAYSTVLFGVKAGLVAMAAVLFALVVAVGGVDGLVQRYIRTTCGGHESTALSRRCITARSFMG